MSSSDVTDSSEPLDFALSSTSGITSENKFDGSSSSDDSDDSRTKAEQAARFKEERIQTVLNILNENILQYYADAIALQKRRDFLLMSLSLLRRNDLPARLKLTDREDLKCYMATANTRLTTVNIDIIHNDSDSFLRINELLDTMIKLGDASTASELCEKYLNACRRLKKSWNSNCAESIDKSKETDKEFTALLLGCAVEDRRNICQRLLLINDHLNYQLLHS